MINLLANGGGLGHLARCSALANALEGLDADCRLFVPRHAARVAREAGISVHSLPPGPWPELPEAQLTVVDSCPGGHYHEPPPEGWGGGNLALLARAQGDNLYELADWATRYEWIYYWEDGLDWLPPYAERVEPIVWSPLPGMCRPLVALIALRTDDPMRRWETAAVAVCERFGLAVEYGRGLPFPAGRRFGHYRLVITHAGANSYFEAQAAGVPAVVIPDPSISSDQELRAYKIDDLCAAIGRAVATPRRLESPWNGATVVAQALSTRV